MAYNERDTVVVQRQALRAAGTWSRGRCSRETMIDVLRPAPRDGIFPNDLERVLGMRVRVPFGAGEHLRWVSWKRLAERVRILGSRKGDGARPPLYRLLAGPGTMYATWPSTRIYEVPPLPDGVRWEASDARPEGDARTPAGAAALLPAFARRRRRVPWTDVMALLEREPALMDINGHIVQKDARDG